MFKGSFVALITPFRDGKVDEAAFEKLVEWHIEQGTHGLVPCGTTGESPTLPPCSSASGSGGGAPASAGDTAARSERARKTRRNSCSKSIPPRNRKWPRRKTRWRKSLLKRLKSRRTKPRS